jgi:hypothetical protein
MVHSTDALKVAAEIKQVTDCQTLSKLDWTCCLSFIGT